MTTQISTSANRQEIRALFEAQRGHQFEVARSTARERIQKLGRLKKAVLDRRQAIRDAVYADFKKPAAEADLTEIYAITTEIKHTSRHLKRWMSRHSVGTPLPFLGSSSWVQYEPKGVCLIIAPWNFPLQLAIGPLVSAIAAGNTAIVKPSEHTPHTSAVVREIIADVFDPREVVVVEGAVETATELLKLPFNHIFFTGAPAIGKLVMRAAAEHLASVTLELGGKSPTIIDETADLKTAVRRIAWGKFLNSGQICIAPDYLFVHESKKDEFVRLMAAQLKALYGDDAATSGAYNRMVNAKHFERVEGYLRDAEARGATIEIGGRRDASSDYIEPTVVSGVPDDALLMQEEIFGPVLPIRTFRSLETPLQVINSKEKPLALYLYSKSERNIRHILQGTRAGGTCINNNDVHFMQPNLPFGGSNNSGIGKSHGWYGFEAFSNARAVYRQYLPGALELLMPPYTSLKQRIIDLTIKWF
ncbi:MAG: aldehyde dehydrogenase family protein [Phaeodactylibacter sp.]|uniref:aldehyde dehydrogenase family protein n=1 Tax=Phaeodactylibacter sp. TaxID=1940289 RepID=UPI0032EF6FB7